MKPGLCDRLAVDCQAFKVGDGQSRLGRQRLKLSLELLDVGLELSGRLADEPVAPMFGW